MRKHCYAGLILLAIILFSALNLSAQEEKNEQLWYCWEETVNPAMLDEYLSFSKELLELCKQENYPFPIFTWTRRSMVYEWWGPIGSLDDIDKIEKEWGKILKIWGEEKTEAYNKTKLRQYSKTCTLNFDLAYQPANSEADDAWTYGRWIEMYLRPGNTEKLVSLLETLNEHRASYGIQEYVQFGFGGLGYQSPSVLVFYSQKSSEDFQNYLESTPEAYQEKFQEYLAEMRKLIAQPPEIYNYYLIWELSYKPKEQ